MSALNAGDELEEMALPSGRMTKGVVRIGDTVRRPANAASGFVAELLALLAQSDCAWAPRCLGQDSQGRDMLSFIPGAVAPKWGYFSDVQLTTAARMIRELHDLTRGSTFARGGVVCHHDPGPNNFVFSNELPVGIIDFDMAEPGDPIEDLGYMGWSWCVSSSPHRPAVATQAQQVRALADAYGATALQRARLVGSIIERQLRNVTFWSARLADPGSTIATPEKMLEVIEWSKREAKFTDTHRAVFDLALAG